MSSVAHFIRLPASTVDQLASDHDRIVKQHGHSVVTYDWSGYVLLTLLEYLDEQGIKLMESPYDALAPDLSETLGATAFLLTPMHKEAYQARLSPSLYRADELRDYFTEFTGTDDEETGQAMLDGISAFECSLASLDNDSVVLVSIG